MKATYPEIITQDGAGYLVDIPDIDIQTEGTSIGDAIRSARDAIGLYGVTVEDEGETIELPSDADIINISDGAFADVGKGFVTIVDVDFDAYRRTLPD